MSAPPLLSQLALWIDPTPATGPVHMAIDELLLENSAIPVLRLYRWAAPEFTFGYPQRWSEIETLTNGHPATRRWTGGGLVAHGYDLTISLAVPATHTVPRPVEFYRLLHTAVLAALQSGFPNARLATAADCHPGLACFTSPACYDLLHNSQKILGGAQRRSRRGLLYQGSLQNLPPPESFPTQLATALASKPTTFDPSSFPDPTPLAQTRYAPRTWNHRR